MYSSLDKVDIVVGDDPNQPLFVQTDHREPAEIEEEPELSIFALTRVLGAQRMDPKALVCYAPLSSGLPPFFEDVLGAAGARIQGMDPLDEQREPERIGSATTSELADKAFAELSARVRRERGLSAGIDGLHELEDQLLTDGLDREEDEISYWSAVVELAAVTGELIRQKHGGNWEFDEPNIALVPFLFRTGNSWLNPTGKAEKFLYVGANERPSLLIQMAGDTEHEAGDGPMLMSFKPADWVEGANAVSSKLFAREHPSAPPLPLAAYGRDYPNTFGYLRTDSDEGKDLEAIKAEALANLARIDVQVEKLEMDGGFVLASVHGSYFAAEKILDVDFMGQMHTLIGSELLAVAIPKKGLMLITDAIATDNMVGFVNICIHEYDSEPGRELYPLPLLVQEGKVVGIALPDGDSDSEAAPKKKRGFFSKLFGR